MEELISVIIPVKNGERYLEAAIAGIQKQNMYTQIIVVDDASTDNTVAIARHMGATVLHHDVCRGQVAGKNTGLNAAEGSYVMFHDADDVMREGALQKMYDALEKDSELSAVMAMVQDFISPDAPEEIARTTVIKQEPYYGLFTGAVLMRKSDMDAIGRFDESLTAGEIMWWKSEIDRHNMTIQKLDLVSADRRVHNNNYGRTNRKKEFQDYARILRARMTAK